MNTTDQPFGIAETVSSRATGRTLGMVGGYEDNGMVQVLDAGPFDAPTLYAPADLIVLPAIIRRDAAIGTLVYSRHYGNPLGTVERYERTAHADVVHLLPVNIPQGEGYPTIAYPIDHCTTDAPINAG